MRKKYSVKIDLKPLLVAIIIFASIDLVFTAAAVGKAMPEEAEAGLRPINTIPLKLTQLIFVGLSVGAISIITLRRRNIELLLSGALLTPLLDVDHLPIVLGIPQPVRPSHSLLFIVIVALAIYIFLRRIDLSLMASSSTMMHLAADSSSFPLLSPLTLKLYNIASLEHVGLVATAIFTSLLSGYAVKRMKNS